MATAIASALAQVPTRRDLAMTGEITLRGRVLAIGGLKEKILAAKRARLTSVILPKRNKKDLDEIPKHILKGIQLIFADTMDDVMKVALRRRTPAKKKAGQPQAPESPKPVSRIEKSRRAEQSAHVRSAALRQPPHSPR
jgi:ATP-dependent Lon protease